MTESIAVGIPVAVQRRGAIVKARVIGEILLRSQKVAAQRVGEFEVGPITARLANDGGPARNDVPGNAKSRNQRSWSGNR